MSKLIYHSETQQVECFCGQIIVGSHHCSSKYTVISFEECTNNCSRCTRFAERENFESQWSKDMDGYTICSNCGMKCEFGEVPKGCECDIDAEDAKFVGLDSDSDSDSDSVSNENDKIFLTKRQQYTLN